MEKLLEVVGCPDHLRVKLASFYLEGPAELWWRAMREIATSSSSSSSSSEVTRPIDWDWGTFLGKLKDRFYPLAIQKQKETEFLFFRQHSLTVTQYANKFLELARFAPTLVSTEQSKMNRFYDGLNFKYQKLIGKSDSFQEMYEQALEKERVCQREDEIVRKRKNKTEGGSELKRQNTGGERNQNPRAKNPKQRVLCNSCRKWHPQGKSCDGRILCLACGKPGHMAKDCWSRLGQGRGIPGNNGNKWQPQSRIQGGNQNQLRIGYQGSGNPQPSGASGAPKQSGGKLYTITSAEEAGPSSAIAKEKGKVLYGTFSVCGVNSRVLFDSGADRSYISACLASQIRDQVLACVCNYAVNLPDGSTLVCKEMLCECPVVIQD